MCMDQITNRLPGIIAIHDDMCIWENKGRTQHTLITANEDSIKNGLVFNSHKCSIRQPQITFYGAIFTTQEMKQTQQKSKPYRTSLPLKIINNYKHF